MTVNDGSTPYIYKQKLAQVKQKAWSQGNLAYKLWPQQIPIYNSIRACKPYLDPVILCARQFGKSFLGVLMAIEDAIINQGFSIVITGPTIRQTVDIVHQGMRIIGEDCPFSNFILRSKSDYRWLIGESEIIVGGFDTRMASRQRGKRALKIYVEEVVDSDPDQFSESIRSDLAPMLTHSPSPSIIYLTTPPRVPNHPFITDVIPQAQLDGVFFKYTINDNAKLSQEQYWSCVKHSGGLDSIEFKREYLCEIIRDTNIMVCPPFNKSLHVGETDSELRAFYQTTADWGGVRDLTVALLHSYNFVENKDLILDERVFPANTPSHEIVKSILDMERGYKIKNRFIDAAGQVLVDLNHQGFTCALPHKDDWRAGINSLNVMLSQENIIINPKCKFLIQSLESGTFNTNKTDFERTQTLGHCDAIAAMSYAMRMMSRETPYEAAIKRDYFQNTMVYPVKSNMESIGKAFLPKVFK